MLKWSSIDVKVSINECLILVIKTYSNYLSMDMKSRVTKYKILSQETHTSDIKFDGCQSSQLIFEE